MYFFECFWKDGYISIKIFYLILQLLSIWEFYCNRVVPIFEHFILYESYFTDCQRRRLLGSKILEQLANCEYKLF